LVSASDLFKAARFFHKVRRRNMTAVVYAHKAGRGNGVGLHYSRFRPAWRFIIPPNQRLGLMPPSQNRHFPSRIREVGLARSSLKSPPWRRELTTVSVGPGEDQWPTSSEYTFHDAKLPIECATRHGRRDLGSGSLTWLYRVQFETRRFRVRFPPSERLWKAGTTGF
jgi:hypothetical protein